MWQDLVQLLERTIRKLERDGVDDLPDEELDAMVRVAELGHEIGTWVGLD